MEISEISAADMTALQAQGYSESDLAMLAKSEVASLLDLPVDYDKEDAGRDLHGEAADDQDASAAAAALAAAAANKEVEGAAAAAAKPEPAAFAPQQYMVEVPADAKAQISAFKAEEADAFKRLMDGKIDADEYQAIKTRTEDAADELKEKVMSASIFEQANQQNNAQAWQVAEKAAFTTFTDEGLDYKAKPSLLAAYNHNLKTLGADPKNEKRDAPWFLAEAHRLTKADLGYTTVAKNNSRGRPNPLDNAEIPPTLRNVPIAATGAVNGDEFAHMRNLDGMALERAHARLTNEQRDRWMAE